MSVLSIVIPVYNSASKLKKALDSVFLGFNESQLFSELEVLVVDDGSDEPEKILEVINSVGAKIIVINLETNKGKAAAVNAGIARSTGEWLIQLDSDDCFVPDWVCVLDAIIKDNGEDNDLILTPCITEDGELTVSNKHYQGELTYSARLQGKYKGEYLVVFRGSFIRLHPFIDLGIKHAGYEEYSYLRMLQLGRAVIVKNILRVYSYDGSSGLSGSWWIAEKAKDRAKHLEWLLIEFENDFKKHAPSAFKKRKLRLVVYRYLAGDGRDWKTLIANFDASNILEFVGCFFLFIFPVDFFKFCIKISAEVGLLSKWG